MLEYLDWCSDGDGYDHLRSEPGESTIPPPSNPTDIERGRSATLRCNINAEGTNQDRLYSTELSNKEGKRSDTFGTCMLAPIIDEQRDDEQSFTINARAAITNSLIDDSLRKLRKRDTAPSPPRVRGSIRSQSGHLEIDDLTDQFENETAFQTWCSEFEFFASRGAPKTDDKSIKNSLFDFFTDALSIVGSTASTKKTGGENKEKRKRTRSKQREQGQILFEMKSARSLSAMSSHSEMSQIPETLLRGRKALESVPENESMDKTVVFNSDQPLMVPQKRESARSGQLFKFTKQKPSKIRERNLKSLCVLVYGKRVARHYEE